MAISRKIQDNTHLKNNFSRDGKVRKVRAEFCAFDRKMQKIWKSQENFDNFDQNLNGKLTFSYFIKYFIYNTNGRCHHFSTTNFPISGERSGVRGEVTAFPLWAQLYFLNS